MMKIHENLLKNTAARVEKYQYFDPFIYQLAKPIISGETYTFSYEGEVGEGVTNIAIYNSGGAVSEFGSRIENVQVKDNRKFVTFVALDKERINIDLRVFFSTFDCQCFELDGEGKTRTWHRSHPLDTR